MREHLRIRRLLDVSVAAAGLTLGAPLFAIVSAAIKLDSKGPVLFRQWRIGRDRRPFETLKFRTMVVRPAGSGPEITSAGDPRITAVGRVLRKTKLDELPQLLNILRGEMSLVGPRPEVPRYVDHYRSDWERVFSVRPGITDLASLTFRDEEGLLAMSNDRERAYLDVILPAKLSLALRGIDEGSALNDLCMIAQTIAAIFGVRDRQTETLLSEMRSKLAQMPS